MTHEATKDDRLIPPHPDADPNLGHAAEMQPDDDLDADAPDSALEDDMSIRDSIQRLIASGREMAGAEINWAKLKAKRVADGLRTWLVFAALALVFLVMGLVIMIVSAIMALAPIVGIVAANLIVAGVAIVAAIICALVARHAFRSLFEEPHS